MVQESSYSYTIYMNLPHTSTSPHHQSTSVIHPPSAVSSWPGLGNGHVLDQRQAPSYDSRIIVRWDNSAKNSFFTGAGGGKRKIPSLSSANLLVSLYLGPVMLRFYLNMARTLRLPFTLSVCIYIYARSDVCAIAVRLLWWWIAKRRERGERCQRAPFEHNNPVTR